MYTTHLIDSYPFKTLSKCWTLIRNQIKRWRLTLTLTQTSLVRATKGQCSIIAWETQELLSSPRIAAILTEKGIGVQRQVTKCLETRFWSLTHDKKRYRLKLSGKNCQRLSLARGIDHTIARRNWLLSKNGLSLGYETSWSQSSETHSRALIKYIGWAKMVRRVVESSIVLQCVARLHQTNPTFTQPNGFSP